jgi:carbonic anhydrase/acetyltransferase-like protein (isoleucine patch superfamily)
MGATILNGADIGEECIVAAGTLVPEGMKIPARSLVMGLPAKVRRLITEGERQGLRVYADHYYEYKEAYLAESALRPPGPPASA